MKYLLLAALFFAHYSDLKAQDHTICRTNYEFHPTASDTALIPCFINAMPLAPHTIIGKTYLRDGLSLKQVIPIVQNLFFSHGEPYTGCAVFLDETSDKGWFVLILKFK
jgi:hypothetical protein